ncbi:class I SAM-dependent methyltransferase [Desulfitobacterium metallireducens]|uniref:rRNA methyltransferase n=1 Tax=Desulfitobacterium metallireducens DSM 15288 TaxID=871968 RepID=W0E923_9FIRM|nr:class I SAM-dependent methyltransferase [Desulfitobacterium metallireducens]AHF07370.1 rRNA methyltransferase [Desulfitobacterium metallireducens DSM 15288]
MSDRLQDIQGFLREIIVPRIELGDTALDLTAGLGRDTLFLAQAVGPNGRVYAFDIQAIALAETQRLLEEEGVAEWVTLHQADHARVQEFVSEPVKLAMFNLGYLPGSDHSVTTQAKSTLQALQDVLKLLVENGILALTVYRGHPGGEEEARAVHEFLTDLPPKSYSVLEGQYINQGDKSPYWILVQKKRGEI